MWFFFLTRKCVLKLPLSHRQGKEDRAGSIDCARGGQTEWNKETEEEQRGLGHLVLTQLWSWQLSMGRRVTKGSIDVTILAFETKQQHFFHYCFHSPRDWNDPKPCWLSLNARIEILIIQDDSSGLKKKKTLFSDASQKWLTYSWWKALPIA